MTSIATTYRVSFHPTDPNITPDECMPAYCYDTLAEAQLAIADDARTYGGDFTGCVDTLPEWHAYTRVAIAAARDALTGGNCDAYPVHVRTGDNPRRIGTYHVHALREGDPMDCTACGSSRGTITAIHGMGNVHAVCADCADDATA